MTIQEIRGKRMRAEELNDKHTKMAVRQNFIKFGCKIVGFCAALAGLGLFFITGNPIQILFATTGFIPVIGGRIGCRIENSLAYNKLRNDFPEMLKYTEYDGEPVMDHSAKIRDEYIKMEAAELSGVKFDARVFKDLEVTTKDVEALKPAQKSNSQDRDEGIGE